MNITRTFVFSFALSLTSLLFNKALFAEVRLPAIIGNHMVLQQNTQVKLWGWSDPGENIVISTSWDTITYKTTGSAKARWLVPIKTPSAGGPHTITIKGFNTITITDVLSGEVWACSGQSNMEMSYNWLKSWKSDLYNDEVEKSKNFQIRFFQVAKATSETPQDNLGGRWMVCEPSSMKNFSLVGYFFGQKINQQTTFPVGLIGSSWGGTPAEVWIPKDSIEKQPELAEVANKRPATKQWTTEPGTAYNAMIHPLVNFNIAGTLWYQGESNVGEGARYTTLLNTLIRSWRAAWGKEFPFYYVQIAPYEGYGKNGISSSLLREAQTKVLETPKTGMVVIHDLVPDIKDIHPRSKKEVGVRLADLALSDTYNVIGLNALSPQLDRFKIEKSKVKIFFTNANKGLVSKGNLRDDFYIAGEDKVFRPAAVSINGNTVTLENKQIKHPVAVRFGFSNSAMPKLFSKDGLPANIFRTDNWDNINTLPEDAKR